MQVGKGTSKAGGNSFSKKVGLAEFKVVMVQPSKEELGEFLGTEIEKDIEYVTEDREENTVVTVKFWLEDVGGDFKIPIQFRLVDKIATSKSGKTQYINQVGMSSWADKKENLATWFTHFTDKDKNPKGEKEYREAYQGEADLYNFIKNALNNGSDFFSPETNIFMDAKKMFRGSDKDLKTVMNCEFLGTVMVPIYVDSYEKDGETKQVNKAYQRSVLPGYFMNTYKTKGVKGNKTLEKFINEITGEYGIKEGFTVQELADYDGSSTTATKATSVPSADDSDY